MRSLIVVLLCLVLVACGRAPSQPVVAWIYGDESAPIVAQLEGFTDETGIPIEIRFGDSTVLTDDLIAGSGAPAADVLVTSNVADIWRAAEEGALRPIQPNAFDAIADAQKDPDRLWSGIRVRLHFVISGVDSKGVAPTYDELGTEGFAGKLCLSSSRLPVNRSLIAFLVNDRGHRPAERLVRRWNRNLALPPFATEEELVAAVRDGRCAFGIASSHADFDGLLSYSPKPHYFDVSAVGVARHAENAESAQRLVGWLLETRTDYFRGETQLRNVSIAGWHDEDARLLAERAGYR
jgi:iron(III) transport system substrate-binding protein